MKKLLLLLTLTLSISFLTGCGSEDDKNASNSSSGAPDSLVGKIIRGDIYVKFDKTYEPLAGGQQRDFEFISSSVVRFPYAEDWNVLIPGVTTNYTYQKTGPNTFHLEVSGGYLEQYSESYSMNMTISGNNVTGTGTVSGMAEGRIQSRPAQFKGTMSK